MTAEVFHNENPLSDAIAIVRSNAKGSELPDLAVADGRLTVRYRSEADLRRSMGLLARAYGWIVQEEVVVPGWGRIDLVLREYPTAEPWLIELKLDLTKPAQLRRAFQQTDGYGRWWSTKHGESCNTFLAGASLDSPLAASIHEAYPEVGYGGTGRLMECFAVWGSRIVRVGRANHRAMRARAFAEVADSAAAELSRLVRGVES